MLLYMFQKRLSIKTIWNKAHILSAFWVVGREYCTRRSDTGYLFFFLFFWCDWLCLEPWVLCLDQGQTARQTDAETELVSWVSRQKGDLQSLVHQTLGVYTYFCVWLSLVTKFVWTLVSYVPGPDDQTVIPLYTSFKSFTSQTLLRKGEKVNKV